MSSRHTAPDGSIWVAFTEDEWFWLDASMNDLRDEDPTVWAGSCRARLLELQVARQRAADAYAAYLEAHPTSYGPEEFEPPMAAAASASPLVAAEALETMYGGYLDWLAGCDSEPGFDEPEPRPGPVEPDPAPPPRPPVVVRRIRPGPIKLTRGPVAPVPPLPETPTWTPAPEERTSVVPLVLGGLILTGAAYGAYRLWKKR